MQDVWNFHRRLVWGNQETIWTLSTNALMTKPSLRILALAEPRKATNIHSTTRPQFKHSCGQVSEIWRRPPAVYSVMPSERLRRISEPRPVSSMYLKQRPRICPIWPLRPSTLSSKASQRILTLAQARDLHPHFALPEKAERQISRAALTAEATPRLTILSLPVAKEKVLDYENRCREAPIRQINPAALQAVLTPRLAELSRPKTYSLETTSRPPQWPVSDAAKHMVASPRLSELAEPPRRVPTNILQFRQDAFIVKESAKNAMCSERIKNLAQPMARR